MRMVDQVFAFGPRHGVIVKLFGQHFAAGEIDPLRQSITVIADTVAHRFGRSRFKIVIHRPRKLGQGKILGGLWVIELARERGIELPISEDVYRVITGVSSARRVYRGLLRVTAGAESEPG